MGTEFQFYRVKRIVEMDGVVKGGHHYFKWCCFYQPVCVLTHLKIGFLTEHYQLGLHCNCLAEIFFLYFP